MTINKDNSAKSLLITAFILIVLQGANLVGVAINRKDIQFNGERSIFNEKRLENVMRDYAPMWFLEGLIKNMNYQTEEIVATMKGDKSRIKEINEKYLEFQKTMLNNMIQIRGGITTNVRSYNNKKSNENTEE